jgi:hypothetical protein
MAIQKITSGILADGAILAADIADGSITTAKIADGNVTSAKIDTVANTQITGLVTSGQIANVANTQVTGSIEATQVGTTVSQLFGMRNRIINGAMVIDQRNAGASVTVTTGTYTLDRWIALATAASKYSVQQNAAAVTPPAGFINYLGVTSLSAYSISSSDAFWLAQRVEGLNVADLAWGTANAQTVTLSFWVRSSLTGTFGGSIQNSARNRSYPFTYTISVADTWEQKSITIAGDTSGTWLTTNGIGLRVLIGLGVGSTFSGTAGAWAGSDFRGATGATSVVGTSGATFYITGVQLEVGSTATPFERRLYGQELALCQRYYQVASSISVVAASADGSGFAATIPFKMDMRATPTVTSTFAVQGTPTIWGYRSKEVIATTANQIKIHTISYTASSEL